MAKDSDHLAGSFETENTGGVLSGLLAEEDVFDRRAMWRLGSWAVASVGAVIVAVLANQSSIGARRDQIAAVDLARQSQQIQSIAKESQNETRRLASAIDTLNGDRDRLYSRVTVLEQGLDSVTGAISRQNSTVAAAPALPAVPPQAVAAVAPQAVVAPPQAPPMPAQSPVPAPAISPVATITAPTVEKPPAEVKVPEPAPITVSSVGKTASTTSAASPATPLVVSKSLLAPPDSAPAKLIEPEKSADTVTAAAAAPEAVASVISDEPEPTEATAPQQVARTEFGIDVGGANSVGGLRALWRGLLKSKSNAALLTLRPIIVVKESSTGLGMQLRLVAGPLADAAAAARICAAMVENERPCETTVFDGQRLAMKAEDQPVAVKPAGIAPAKPAAAVNRRSNAKRTAASDDAAKKPETSTLSSFFGRH